MRITYSIYYFLNGIFDGMILKTAASATVIHLNCHTESGTQLLQWKCLCGYLYLCIGVCCVCLCTMTLGQTYYYNKLLINLQLALSSKFKHSMRAYQAFSQCFCWIFVDFEMNEIQLLQCSLIYYG